MGIAVRPARAYDINWILSELKSFSHFFGTRIPLFGSEEYARAGVFQMVRDHLFLIAEDESYENEELNRLERMGFIAGYVGTHPFNPQIKLLTEVFWWVPEIYRDTRAGFLLLLEYLRYGQANCDWVTFSLEAKSPVNEDTLTRRGFKLQERNYLLEVGAA